MRGIGTILLILFLSINLSGQNDILIKIDGEEISSEEFLWFYKKNKTNSLEGDFSSIEEYLELFVDFKLKVKEAENEGFNKSQEFRNEFQNYKDKAEKPFLIDDSILEDYVKEAYQRLKFEIRASHVLVKLPRNPTSEDTLKAWTKAIEIRRRIENGEPFESVAKGASDDPSAKFNGGDLGYFTAFQMVYPFETAAYNLDPGIISEPVQTQFGYHIIKVKDRREARGEVKVAHIMLLAPQSLSPQQIDQKEAKINEIYHLLKEGRTFESLAREYSEDRGSAGKGGELPWFGVGRMVKEFEEVAFRLENVGDVSKPVRTSYGFHLIKLLDRKELEPFDQMISRLENRVVQSDRYVFAKRETVERIKTTTHTLIQDTNLYYFLSYEDKDSYTFLENDTLFSNNELIILVRDFGRYLEKNNVNFKNDFYLLKQIFDYYLNNLLLENYIKSKREKNPDFRYTIQEYYEGLLVFNITDEKIWSRAETDTTALKNYYSENQDQYMGEEKFEGTIIQFENRSEYEKVLKYLERKGIENIRYNDILKKFDDFTLTIIESGLYQKGENQIIDAFVWNQTKGIQRNRYIVLGEIIGKQPLPFNEIRGIVISDYQKYLEDKWEKELREKYSVEVNEDLLESLKDKNNE